MLDIRLRSFHPVVNETNVIDSPVRSARTMTNEGYEQTADVLDSYGMHIRNIQYTEFATSVAKAEDARSLHDANISTRSSRLTSTASLQMQR